MRVKRNARGCSQQFWFSIVQYVRMHTARASKVSHFSRCSFLALQALGLFSTFLLLLPYCILFCFSLLSASSSRRSDAEFHRHVPFRCLAIIVGSFWIRQWPDPDCSNLKSTSISLSPPPRRRRHPLAVANVADSVDEQPCITSNDAAPLTRGYPHQTQRRM